MIKIDNPNGKDFAKVLHYYGLLDGEAEFKIICPFHEDVNPSLLINLESGIFKCFGCNNSGDALKFVMLINKNLNDLQSLILYYKILKSKKVKHIDIIIHHRKRKANGQALIEAGDYYYGLKQTDWLIDKGQEKKYMLKRGFSEYSLNRCKCKINYNDSYPLIFPMFDMNVFKGWVCRTTNKVIEQKRKYLYNVGFSRRNTLVGRYDNEVVIVVEGFMDWLKMKQYGIKYVCAFLGWKATIEQISKLKDQGVKYIISALDNDECGNKGTKFLESLNLFKVIRFQYPNGIKDPGEMDSNLFRVANIKTKKILNKIRKDGNE